MQIFINDEGNHNKFWIADASAGARTSGNGLDVEISWGRLGTKGRSKIYSFKNEYDRALFLDQKIREKERKNYREVDWEHYCNLKLTAEMVGTTYKLGASGILMDVSEEEFLEKTGANLSYWKRQETRETHDFSIYKKCSSKDLCDPKCKPTLFCFLALDRKVYGGLDRDWTRLLITEENNCDLADTVHTWSVPGGEYWLFSVKHSESPIKNKISEKLPEITQAIINNHKDK